MITALPVSATGSADWLNTAEAEKRVGTAHAIANNMAIGCFGASWLLRRRGRTTAGVCLGLAGTAVTGASSFLGGHLTYRRGVGVNTTAFQTGPAEWAPLALDDELSTDGVVRGSIGDLSFVVVAGDADRSVHVMESRCTHRGASLHDGSVENGCVVCPWHQSRFDLTTGAVVSGPASVPQPVYETKVVDATVMIRRNEAGALRVNTVDASRSG